MGTSNPSQCIDSFRDALKRAGLEERRADISPGLMAQRLRPRIQARSNMHSGDAKRGAKHESARRRFSTSFWILILAFAVGLAPALAIGAFAWAAKSKGVAASSCSSWMADSPAPVAPGVRGSRPNDADVDLSVTET
jgi:hypothetical protein